MSEPVMAILGILAVLVVGFILLQKLVFKMIFKVVILAAAGGGLVYLLHSFGINVWDFAK